MKLKNVALVAALLFSAVLPAQANECYRAFNQGDFRSAVSTCTSQINSGQYQGASQGHLFTTRGRAYWSLGEYDKALADLNRAVRLLSDNPAAWNNRCALLNQLRRYDQALEDCNRALELNPRYHLAYSNRGAVWRGKRLLQRALVDHNQAIRLYPRRDLYFFRRGRVHMDLKNYDAAIGDFYKAISLNPRNHRAYFQRGRAWKLKGKLEWALWDFNKCLQINPRVYNAYYHRAVIYQQKGDRTRAIADLERYLQLRPEDEEVKGLLARLKGKPAPKPKATPPAGPIKPPAPAQSLTVGRGWRLSVRRSLGIKGVILTQGRQVNLDSLADLAFLARVTRAADGRVEAFECRVNRAVSKELDPQSGQVKQSALAAPGQYLSVNLASGRAQVRDLGSNQPVANEDLRDLLGWPLPLVLWPHRNLRPGMRWTISGPRLVKLLSFLDLTAGRLEMSVQQVARDPSGFTVARLAGRLTASLKLEQVPVRLNAKVSLVLPLELGVARELRIEGAMNGQGTMPDAQGNPVSYIFRGQGSMRQTITPHAQLVQWALGRRPASPAGQSQVRRPPDPASLVPAGQRPPAGPAGPAKKPVPTTVPPGRQPPPVPDTAPVPKGPDIPSY